MRDGKSRQNLQRLPFKSPIGGMSGPIEREADIPWDGWMWGFGRDPVCVLSCIEGSDMISFDGRTLSDACENKGSSAVNPICGIQNGIVFSV